MTIKDINPVTTGHDLREDQPLMRRLFEVNYTCPLCGRNHMAETYVQSATSNLDDLNAEAVRCMSDARTAVPLLQNHMRFVHTEQGNFTELLEHLKGSTQEADLIINTVTMTHEENLSCDQCAHQFDSPLELAVTWASIPPTAPASLPPPAIPISDSFKLDGSPHRLPSPLENADDGANRLQLQGPAPPQHPGSLGRANPGPQTPGPPNATEKEPHRSDGRGHLIRHRRRMHLPKP